MTQRAEQQPGRPVREPRKPIPKWAQAVLVPFVALGARLADAKPVFSGPLPQSAPIEEPLVASVQAASPEPAPEVAPTTITLYAPENPGKFPLVPRDSYQQDQPSSDRKGDFVVNGDTLSLRFSLVIDDTKATVENPVTGFVLASGAFGGPAEKRLFAGSQGPNAGMISFMKGRGYVNPEDKVATAELWTTLKQGTESIIGIDISPDGTSITGFFANGTSENFVLPDGDSLYAHGRELTLRFQTPGGGVLTVPEFVMSGQFEGLTLIPPPPEQPVIPERPPTPIEPLFGQMPREVIGNLGSDGMAIYIMGKKYKIDEKAPHLVQNVVRQLLLPNGVELQVALYSRGDDIPKMITTTQRIFTTMPTGCTGERFSPFLTIAQGYAEAGNRFVLAFAVDEPLDKPMLLAESGRTTTVREVFSRIFSQQVLLRAFSINPAFYEQRKGPCGDTFTPAERAFSELPVFEIHPAQPTSLGK